MPEKTTLKEHGNKNVPPTEKEVQPEVVSRFRFFAQFQSKQPISCNTAVYDTQSQDVWSVIVCDCIPFWYMEYLSVPIL